MWGDNIEIDGRNITVDFSHTCVFQVVNPFKIKTKGVCTINNLHIKSKGVDSRRDIFSPTDGIVFINNMIIDNGDGDIGLENGYEKPRREG